MDDWAASIIERQTALADFDHARDDFEAAMRGVPEEALSYKPEGDDYSISDLVHHVTSSMQMYTDVLSRMEQAQYQEVRLVATPDDSQLLQQNREMPVAQARTDALDEMEQVHDRLAGKLGELTHENYALAAPVYYPGANEPFPTRAADIIQWLTDHYREHVPQVAQMVEGWNRRSG